MGFSFPADLAFEIYEPLDAPAKSSTVIKDAAHTIMWGQPKAWAEALVRTHEQGMPPIHRLKGRRAFWQWLRQMNGWVEFA